MDSCPCKFENFSRVPSSPMVARKLIDYSASGNYCNESLVEVICQDPATTARILALANSAAMNTGKNITDLSDAVVNLGAKSALISALGFNLRQLCPVDALPRDFPQDDFWRDSVVSAVATSRLCHRILGGAAKFSFETGLLATYGRIILAMMEPEKYSELLAESVERWPTRQEERDAFTFDFMAVSGCVFCEWKMPEEISDCIHTAADLDLNHWTPGDASMIMSAILLVGAEVVEFLCGDDKAKALSRVYDMCSRLFALPKEETRAFVVDVGKTVAATLPLFGLKMTEEESRNMQFKSTAEIARLAVSLGVEKGDVEAKLEEKEEAFEDLVAKTTGYPHFVQRISRSMHMLSGQLHTAVFSLGMAAIFMFMVVYWVKSGLGINLLEGMHLEQVFF